MVYITLFSVVATAIAGRRSGKYIQVIPFIILFLFAALRKGYGNDYASYAEKFAYIHAGGTSPFEHEYLFTFLNASLPNFFSLIALTSLLFVAGIYIFLRCNLEKEQIWMGVLIFVINPYLYLINLSSLRQCLAMLLFLLAARFAYQRKVILYVLCILIGALFHKSAILLLPIYFFATPKKISWRWLVVISLALLALLQWDGFSNIVQITISFFEDSNYNFYVSSGLTNSLRATVLTSCFFLYVVTNLPELHGKSLVFGKLYLIGCILGILAYRLSMLTRIQMYFDIFSIAVLPGIFCQVQSEGAIVVNSANPLATFWKCINKYAMPVLLLLIYILRIYSFFTNPMWASFTTYHTILD